MPQDFIPVIDSLARKVIHIDFPPHYKRNETGEAVLTTKSGSGLPPSLDADAFTESARERIPPPRKAHDFLPDLMEKTEEDGYHPRTDLKPLHIVQPEGVSFKMNGHEIEWQKWKFHIGEVLLFVSHHQPYSATLQPLAIGRELPFLQSRTMIMERFDPSFIAFR